MNEENKRKTICFNVEIGDFIKLINSAKTTDDILDTLIIFKEKKMYLPEYAGDKPKVFIELAINKTKEILELDDNDPLLKDLKSLDFSSDDFNRRIMEIKEEINRRNPQGIHISNLNEKRKQSNTKGGCCLQ